MLCPCLASLAVLFRSPGVSAPTSRTMDTTSTAGKLVRSNELYVEVRQTNAELKDLIADIKAHLDKYVKVKFSLFK